jgi:hypothetical protein
MKLWVAAQNLILSERNLDLVCEESCDPRSQNRDRGTQFGAGQTA